MKIQQMIDILEAAKTKIGPNQRISFYLADDSTLGRYFEVSGYQRRKGIVEPYNPANPDEFLGSDKNGDLVTLEITEEKDENLA